ncbi:hypothetical protein BKA80DRAFT_123521 [Phyllosticta citrichinensis]
MILRKGFCQFSDRLCSKSGLRQTANILMHCCVVVSARIVDGRARGRSNKTPSDRRER